MSDEHKAALARGRQQSAAVKAYLEALEASKAPKPKGRRKSVEQMQERLTAIGEAWAESDAMTRLKLAAEHVELEQEITEREAEAEPVDLQPLEEAFIEVAAEYSVAKGVPYAAFRMLNVPPKVLRAAGIRRGF
jgi:hypothetical protein